MPGSTIWGVGAPLKRRSLLRADLDSGGGRSGPRLSANPGVISAQVTDESGTTLTHGGGYLTLSEPWPAMLRGIYGDPERYRETYWSRFPGSYFAGGGAKRDADGYFWLLGPVDDVRSGYESRAGHGVEELRTRSVAPPSEE